MAARRGSQIVTLVAVVAALIAVWWLGRGEEAKPTSAPITIPSPSPSPTPIPSPSPSDRRSLDLEFAQVAVAAEDPDGG